MTVLNAGLPVLYRERDTDDKVLKRFLDIYGFQFDILKSHAEGFTTIFDVDTCDSKFLPHLAHLVGVQLSDSFTEDTKRKFIKNAVFIHSRKGTVPGIETFCEAVTGWDCSVVEGFLGVFITNHRYHLTFDGPTYTTRVAEVGQEVAYQELSRTWNPDRPDAFTHLYIFLRNLGQPTAFKESLLNTLLPAQIPIGVTYTLIFI